MEFERSTGSGVYTAAQARRGEATYASLCTGCHSAASHAGATFWTNWGGRPLSELFVYLTESMPKSDPGTLTPAEYGAIVAFMLKQNGMPAGADELPSDTTALRRIRVDSTKVPH
jgi:mono/diheme cytochrome c family protein